MNGNCHFLFASSVGLALSLNLDKLSAVLPNITPSPETATLFILGGLVGGVFPDTDNPVSYVGKLTYPISKYLGKFSSNASSTKEYNHHRGILHDPTIYLVGLFVSYFLFSPLIGFFIGGITHVYLDAYNPSGVPFMLRRTHLHLGNMPSGSKKAKFFSWLNSIIAILIGIGFFLYNLLPSVTT